MWLRRGNSRLRVNWNNNWFKWNSIHTRSSWERRRDDYIDGSRYVIGLYVVDNSRSRSRSVNIAILIAVLVECISCGFFILI